MIARAKIVAAIKELEWHGFNHTAALLKEILEKHEKGAKHAVHGKH